jgi:alkylation response protein AidB-like acyl-CoA dehydrogenase
MRFVLDAVLDAPASWAAQPDFAELDLATACEVLGQAGRFTTEVLAPLNASGDLQGCEWTADVAGGHPTVTTPEGFPAAWAAYVQAGWPALPCDTSLGGQGLPLLLNAALSEMLLSTNHGWSMYPGLLHGAYECLKAHATPELAERYLPKLVSGEWLATMCLTEPQAGSDLGQVRSKMSSGATQAVNGARVRVSGNKIFISGGEHDLTDNIVHLVLARLPDAPSGTKGLSLALVPKLLPDGRRNRVFCDGIEKKMGIKASATCQMRFDDAEGWLLGAPGNGLAAMFLMMNSARLHVGVQGLGHLEAATQRAVAYALDRNQLRAPSRPVSAGTPSGPDLIAWHPAMRRILLGLQAQSAGARVLAYWTAMLLDESSHHPDADRRKACNDLVALLTPVVKGFLTDIGHRGADDALGVFGGYGFIHDYGIEQHVRDSRIGMIYEGTNEIQAIDLVMRKLLDDPRRIDALLAEFDTEVATQTTLATPAADTAEASAAATEAHAWAATLAYQARLIRESLTALRAARAADPEAPLRVADDILHGLGHAMLAWGWARLSRAAGKALSARASTAATGGETAGAAAAEASTEGYGDHFLHQQVELAAYGRDWLLPAAAWRWQRVTQGAPALPWVRA